MSKTNGKVIENFEVTPEQRAQIAENAAWFGMKKAEYLRHMALTGGIGMTRRAA